MKVYVDGSPSRLGYMAMTERRAESGKVISTAKPVIINSSSATSNIAEYRAVYEAIKGCKSMKVEGQKIMSLEIISDSMLIVNQLNGEYAVRDPKMQKWYDKIMNIMNAPNVPIITVLWVPRKRNKMGRILG